MKKLLKSKRLWVIFGAIIIVVVLVKVAMYGYNAVRQYDQLHVIYVKVINKDSVVNDQIQRMLAKVDENEEKINGKLNEYYEFRKGIPSNPMLWRETQHKTNSKLNLELRELEVDYYATNINIEASARNLLHEWQAAIESYNTMADSIPDRTFSIGKLFKGVNLPKSILVPKIEGGNINSKK